MTAQSLTKWCDLGGVHLKESEGRPGAVIMAGIRRRHPGPQWGETLIILISNLGLLQAQSRSKGQ